MYYNAIMSLIVDSDSIIELTEQLALFVTPPGKVYLEQLQELIKWSSRNAAAKQLAQVVSSGMSRPLDVHAALNYLKRMTVTRFKPAPGQGSTKDRDIEVFFQLASQLYDNQLWEPTEQLLEDYHLIFPEEGDKYICAHSRATCECGILQPHHITSPYCDECGRPRKLCNAPALLNGRCADHGGRIPEGASKGSIYRQFMEPHMAEAHARVEAEGNLSLTAEMGIATTALAKLLGETRGLDGQRLKKLQSKLTKAVESEDEDAVLSVGNEMQAALSEQESGSKKADEMRKWIQVITLLTQQERENRKAAAEYIHIEEFDRRKDELLRAFRVGMDRSYAKIRKLTADFIMNALTTNPGDDPRNVAQIVTRNLLDSESIIEHELLSAYREMDDD